MQTWLLVLSILSKAVLVVLFLLSVWSIAIIRNRWSVFKPLENENFETIKKLAASPISEIRSSLSKQPTGLLQETLKTLTELSEGEKIDSEKAQLRIKSFLSLKKNDLEKGFTTLATLGSNAPFIGLFGTVLGIINAFGVLSETQTAASSVMSGLAEALIATAVGLFVAIPAVVAFNIFTRKLKTILSQCEALRDFFLSVHSNGSRS
jgi:biopolymer transport protein ExbB/TolQ